MVFDCQLGASTHFPNDLASALFLETNISIRRLSN